VSVELPDGGGTQQTGGTGGGGLGGGAPAGQVTAGPNSPSLSVNDTNAYWSSPDRLTAGDGLYAWYWWDVNAHISSYVKTSGFNFAIPSNATINGIVVEVKKRSSTTDIYKDNAIRLIKGGSIETTDKSKDTNWPATFTYVSYGSSSDLWGDTWTPTDINSSNFGFALSVDNTTQLDDFSMASVDHVRITVYYTPAAGGGTPPGDGGGTGTGGGTGSGGGMEGAP
jgi:hypothetical protein